MPSFYLPYHFVPVKERTEEQKKADVAVEELRATPRLGHHHYAPGTYSGRILCRLTNESPMFIGSKRDESTTPATIKPFELGGKPAIPGSSLRGLLSSIAEAASGSALRVLDDGLLSYRKGMGEALHAVGMVVELGAVDGESRFGLRPLVLPLLESPGPGEPARLPSEFVPVFARKEAPDAPLKAFIGNFGSIRDQRRFEFRTFRSDQPRYYGLRLRRRTLQQDGRGWSLPPDTEGADLQRRKGRAVVAQDPLESKNPVPWESLDEDQRQHYTKGIVRVLGVWGRDDVPKNKKHELFLPLPPDVETVDEIEPIEILPYAVDRFHELAHERSEARAAEDGDPLPYEPKDTLRNPKPEDQDFRLKDGDLVFFRPTSDGQAVEEVALSSIWRGRVEEEVEGEKVRATPRTFFSAVDEDLVPFHRERERITHAEQLFGFVSSDQAAGVPGEAPVQGLAGRLKVSNARLVGADEDENPYLREVPLKVLASPKPPSPALYFRPAGRKGYIAKDGLKPRIHHPQGRKMYVHHTIPGGESPWESDSPEDRAAMINQIKPIRWKRQFLFHIDFDNLTKQDLGLLLYALRPTEKFRHKLGMGKPLGLGTVCIDPLAVLRIDRRRRYTGAGLDEPRYHQVWQADGVDSSHLLERHYEEEVEAMERVVGERAKAVEPDDAQEAIGPLELDFERLRDAYRESMDLETREALELLGTVSLRPVQQPLVDGQDDPEDETFKWFVANEQLARKLHDSRFPPPQSLEPLDHWLKNPRREGRFPSLDTSFGSDD